LKSYDSYCPPNPEIIQQTIDFWKTKSNVVLTEQEAAESITNIRGFFSILEEWNRESERKKTLK
jgi:hypothetical protein